MNPGTGGVGFVVAAKVGEVALRTKPSRTNGNLTIPSIHTYVYEGYDDEHGYLFLDAETYVEKTQGKSAEGGHYLSSPEGAIPIMIDKKHLIEWLKEEHSPKLIGKSYEYKAV